ncbi:protein translocase subunit seca2 [Quercus suber]|uniref:Protein translocase subunit seca2 n=1 Tax=Quercus suber TaxID=58331 RepID=A0AAW0MBT1_QUESU
MNRLSSAVNIRSFRHRNSLEEYKLMGVDFSSRCSVQLEG